MFQADDSFLLQYTANQQLLIKMFNFSTEKISKIAKLASAVWGVGKQEEHKEKTLFSCSHTAPSFLHKYGEDACFVSSTNTMDIIGKF